MHYITVCTIYMEINKYNHVFITLCDMYLFVHRCAHICIHLFYIDIHSFALQTVYICKMMYTCMHTNTQTRTQTLYIYIYYVSVYPHILHIYICHIYVCIFMYIWIYGYTDTFNM